MMPGVSAWLKSKWPTPDALAGNRWLKWLGPSLFHHRLWVPRRKTLAAGLAIGVFFGFLIPLAQIPASAVLATLMRANLPAAMASTLVTNPVTFGPVYYVAYKLGVLLVGPAPPAASATPATPATPTAPATPTEPATPATPTAPTTTGAQQATDTASSSWVVFVDHVTGVGKPLAVGLVIFAISGACLVYGLANLVWVIRVRRKRQRRLRGSR